MNPSAAPPDNSKGSASRNLPARPRFLANFPDHAGLSQAVAAFEVGNYAKVSQLCTTLLETEEDVDVRRAATELLRRLKPDRLIVGILWGSFVLLGLIILWAYANSPH